MLCIQFVRSARKTTGLMKYACVRIRDVNLHPETLQWFFYAVRIEPGGGYLDNSVNKLFDLFI